MRSQTNSLFYSYLVKRLNDPTYNFSHLEIQLLERADLAHCNRPNMRHPLIFNPVEYFESKEPADSYCVALWNETFPNDFSVSSISELRDSAGEYVIYADAKFPNGIGASSRDRTLYVAANSPNAFVGIQRPSKSKFAMTSFIATLNSHAEFNVREKPFLTKNLKFVKDHVSRYHSVMSVSYADVCLSAKTSSASMDYSGSFRDFCFENELNDIIQSAVMGNVPHLIYAGTRSDRRGKYRLICSFDGRFRVIDYMLNHGAYRLCKPGGILSRYTTEGVNNTQMWRKMVSMVNRPDDTIMICLDYKGYDSQISLKEYLDIVLLLNEHRISSSEWSTMIHWYHEWMTQPKPLVTKSTNNLYVLIPLYRTLASGLHGTHSHQNLIGISTSIEARNRGIEVLDFWSNGDDQNSLIRKQHLDRYIEFQEDYFNISWNKSLVNHEMAVWGKQWFAKDYHPIIEIGTLRSLWEREGGEVSIVEHSKFQANYSKIINVAIYLIRCECKEVVVRNWIDRLADEVEIDPNRIPVSLVSMSSETLTTSRGGIPRGLLSVKDDLMGRSFHFQALGYTNYFDFMQSMYERRVFFNMTPEDVMYHRSGTQFEIKRGFDYSRIVPIDVPWHLKHLYSDTRVSLSDCFVRDVLQSTKSYDGPCSRVFVFNDLYSLAIAINERNKYMWRVLRNE